MGFGEKLRGEELQAGCDWEHPDLGVAPLRHITGKKLSKRQFPGHFQPFPSYVHRRIHPCVNSTGVMKTTSETSVHAGKKEGLLVNAIIGEVYFKNWTPPNPSCIKNIAVKDMDKNTPTLSLHAVLHYNIKITTHMNLREHVHLL